MSTARLGVPDATMWDLVVARAEATPDAIVVVDDGGDRATAAEYRTRSETLAASLAARGVHGGDCVSWILPSTVDAAVLIGALARIGAVQNPLVPIYGAKEIRFITAQAGTRLLITPGVFRGIDFTTIAREVASDVGFDVVEAGELFEPGGVASAALPPAPDDPDHVRWLFYTSGSTAEPKGVKHSDRSFIAAGLALEPAGLRPGARWAGAVPITHIGVPSLFAAALAIGVSIHLVAVFDPVGTCEQFREWEIDMIAGVGSLVTALLEYQGARVERQFPALRVLMTGGGPRLPGALERVRGTLGCALAPSYGMTECPIATASSPDDPDQALAEGEGRPTSGVEVRIVADDGRVVGPSAEGGPGVEGEVRVKGPQLFAGYVDPALDGAAFDADGFFRSGDLGYIAAGGYLVITGRIKEVIVRNGENLSIREIEDILLQHPAVADAAAVGVTDDRTGERVCAAVVVRAGGAVDLDGIRTFCLEHRLMSQKLPEQLVTVDRIPRNAMGKVIRPELRKMIETAR
jgi:acyl-CoA synthetase (AMP-forming)/AMP-acid ligase II